MSKKEEKCPLCKYPNIPNAETIAAMNETKEEMVEYIDEIEKDPDEGLDLESGNDD